MVVEARQELPIASFIPTPGAISEEQRQGVLEALKGTVHFQKAERTDQERVEGLNAQSLQELLKRWNPQRTLREIITDSSNS